jgi:hypothetical protein
MAQDFELDARPAAAAPPDWTETMTQAAIEAGLVVETSAGPSVIDAVTRLAKRLAQWAEEPALAAPIEALLLEGKATFDPPLIRAALSAGAELTLSAALIRWPTEPRDELEAIARAQTLLAAGARIGISGAPSNAALDALDAAARMAEPVTRDGPAILVRPSEDASQTLLADEAARQRSDAALAAGARALDAALAELAIEAVRNGLNTEHGGVRRKAAVARVAGAPDADILAALAGAVSHGAYSAALDAGASSIRRRIAIAAPEASGHALTAFAARAIDPTGAIAGDEEANVIAAALSLPRFSESGAFDAAAFETATRLLVRALDAAHGAHGAAPRRPIVIRLEGLASLLLRSGLAYDSDKGRAFAAEIAALAHAAEEAAVKAARETADALTGRIGARVQAIYRALPTSKTAALRAALAIAFANDSASARRLGATAGIAPIASVAAYGIREDGGFGRLLSDDAREGLAALGRPPHLARRARRQPRCARFEGPH